LVFEKSQQLGGHFSRAHQGQSRSYKIKIEKRKARTHFRESLNLAKKVVKRDDYQTDQQYAKALKLVRE
jgi:hypothetical protein